MDHGCTHERRPTARYTTLLASLLLIAGIGTVRAEPSDGRGPNLWTIAIENDGLTGATKDRDYTAGFSGSLVGPDARRIAGPNYRALEWLDSRLGVDRLHRSERAAYQQDGVSVGLQIFTPDNIANPDLIPTDRPYANVLSLAHSHYGLDETRNVLYESTFTVGLIGSRVAESLQDGLHTVIRSAAPQGYRNQISNGGELTARYGVARHALLASSRERSRFDLRYSLEGTAGFVTEAAAGIGMRWGVLGSPWWSASPQGSYATRIVPNAIDGVGLAGRDFHFWAGLTLRARVYNALLQGQFRSSELTYGTSDLERFVLEGGVGVTRNFGRVQLTYAVRFHTPELESGHGARDVGWAGITVTVDPRRVADR
jgi:hypothetical protein